MPSLPPTVTICELLPLQYLLPLSHHRFQHALLHNPFLISYEFSHQKVFLPVLRANRRPLTQIQLIGVHLVHNKILIKIR